MTQRAITSEAPVEMARDEQIGQVKGLLDPILRKLTKSQIQSIIHAGGQLQDGVRTLVQGLVAKLTNTYLVTVDYAKSLPDMIKAGNYGYANKNINAKNFSITGDGKADVELVLVHFGRDIESDNVLAELDKLGLRPAILPELLAFGETHPEVQREFPIIALGSVWAGRVGLRRVPYLDGWSGRRGLSLDWFGDGWHGRCRFAAVRK